jgi:predicted HTH transcriptional regulator
MKGQSNKIDKTIRYVKKNGSITNQECRKLLDLRYDHSTKFLKNLCEDGILIKTGKASGTKYVLSSK